MDTDQRSAPRPTPNSTHRPARTTRAARLHFGRVLPRLGSLFVALGLVFAVLPAAPASAYSGTAAAAESQFFNLLNSTRASAGLGPLAYNSALSDYARNWSYQMGAAQNLVHSPNLAAETAAAVPDWNRAGENIGRGGSVDALHQAFYNSAPHRANMLGAYNQVGVGVVVVGTEIWVTFRFANGSLPKPRDATPPNTLMNAPLAASQPAGSFTAGWWGEDTGSGVAYFNVDVSENGGGWVRWLDRIPAKYLAGADAAGDFPFFGAPGRSYAFRVQAVDNAGNASGTSPTLSTAVSASAPKPMPFSAAYSIGRRGEIAAVSSVPITGPQWNTDAIRGFVARPQGGGYEVDYSGGVWAVGGAPNVAQSAYFSGWDIVRGIALNPDGKGGYVLDGFGGVWPFGNASKVVTSGYFRGWDIARDIIVLPTSTATNPAGYVMDAWGGLHPFGSAPKITQGGYWPGWDIARDAVANPNGPGGWVLDGWGGVHPFNGAPNVAASGFWNGWDIARGLTIYKGPNGLAGYVLDGWGGIHPVNNAPAPTTTKTWPYQDYARFLTLTP